MRSPGNQDSDDAPEALATPGVFLMPGTAENTALLIPVIPAKEVPAEEALSEKRNIVPLTVQQAAKDLAKFWPFLLRTGVRSVSAGLMTYIIAQKELDLVGAYTAYEAAIEIAIGFLCASIFPLVTLMSDAKSTEDEKSDAVKKAQAREKIRTIWHQGIIFATALSVPAVIFGLTASPIFKLFKQPDVVTEHSQRFLTYSTPGFVANIFYRLTARTVSGLGVRKSILLADSVDAGMELGLAYVFLNGKWGMPELGLAGVAAAYSISKSAILLGHLAYMFASPRCLGFDYTPYHLFQLSGSCFDKTIFKKLIGAGIPDGLNSVASGVSKMLVVMFCGQSGTAPLVGLQAATVFSEFAQCHMSAVFNAASNKMGCYYSVFTEHGNKDTVETKNTALQNAKMVAKFLFAICGVMSLIACGVAFAIPKQLAKLFIDESDASKQVYLSHAINFLKIQGVFELLAGILVPAQCILGAILDNRFVMFSTILFVLLCNPAAVAATHYGLHKNSEWVYSASGLGTVLMICALLYRFFGKFNGRKADTEIVAAAKAEAYAPRSFSICDKLRQLVWRKNDTTAAALAESLNAGLSPA